MTLRGAPNYCESIRNRYECKYVTEVIRTLWYRPNLDLERIAVYGMICFLFDPLARVKRGVASRTQPQMAGNVIGNLA